MELKELESRTQLLEKLLSELQSTHHGKARQELFCEAWSLVSAIWNAEAHGKRSLDLRKANSHKTLSQDRE